MPSNSALYMGVVNLLVKNVAEVLSSSFRVCPSEAGEMTISDSLCLSNVVATLCQAHRERYPEQTHRNKAREDQLVPTRLRPEQRI